MSKSRKNKTWDLGNIEISHKRGVKGISRIKVRGELWMISVHVASSLDCRGRISKKKMKFIESEMYWKELRRDIHFWQRAWG